MHTIEFLGKKVDLKILSCMKSGRAKKAPVKKWIDVRC